MSVDDLGSSAGLVGRREDSDRRGELQGLSVALRDCTKTWIVAVIVDQSASGLPQRFYEWFGFNGVMPLSISPLAAAFGEVAPPFLESTVQLFAGSQRGGERAAFMCSMIAAKVNDMDPQV